MNKVIPVLLILLAFGSCMDKKESSEPPATTNRTWWKEGVIYQIYPVALRIPTVMAWVT